MNNFTHDELNLMRIYNSSGTRSGLIRELRDMHSYLADDETELLALTDSVIGKLEHISDAEYAKLDLFPDIL